MRIVRALVFAIDFEEKLIDYSLVQVFCTDYFRVKELMGELSGIRHCDRKLTTIWIYHFFHLSRS